MFTYFFDQLLLYNAPLPSCAKGNIITDGQKIMQSKINAACTYIHSDTLHKLEPGTGKPLHTHICVLFFKLFSFHF